MMFKEYFELAYYEIIFIGVGSEYLPQPSGYNSYHKGTTPFLRKVVIPPPPRPRLMCLLDFLSTFIGICVYLIIIYPAALIA